MALDGEGYITISLVKEKRRKSGLSFQPKFVISNTNKELIQKLREIIGEGRIDIKRPPLKAKWGKKTPKKTKYDLQLYSNAIREIIPQIKGWLICKREHAELMEEFLKYTKRGGFSFFLDPYTKRKIEIFERIRELNGKHKLPEYKRQWLESLMER